MLVHTGFKYRMEPNAAQRKQLAQFAGACRWVWNEALAWKEEAWLVARSAGGKPNARASGYVGMCARLTMLRHDTQWLADVPCCALQQTLKDLDQAFSKFYTGAAGFPSFKSRGNGAFRVPSEDMITVKDGAVKLPKLGFIKFRDSRPIPDAAKICNATVTECLGQWFVSFCVEHEICVPTVHRGPPVGVDLGVAKSMALSTGGHLSLPVQTERETARVASMARALSRKQKGSRRWKDQLYRLTKKRQQFINRRRDAAHKATTILAKDYSVVVLEDLKLKAMTGSAKGTAEDPGKNVAQKAGLNRSMLAQAHGETRRMLEYKCQRNGGEFRTVPAQYTSQKCSCCGHTAAENRQSQSRFSCIKCGHTENADANASKNILAAGLAVKAHGGKGIKAPKEVRSFLKKKQVNLPMGPSSI